EDMWGVPENLDLVKVQESVDRIGFSLNYRSMCRFFSGFFWKHPAIQEYEWIWRLDVDIEWHCDIPYDPFMLMQESGKLYGFQHIAGDPVEVQRSLAANVSEFLAGHPDLIPEGANLRFQWREVEKALSGRAGSEDWTRMTFNNNWEISHRSLWESYLYTAFFQHLDDAGGFFYERWGDAPVHTLGVSFALRKDQVMYFNDTGYQHQGWEYNCPDLPRCGCYKDPASLSCVQAEFSHGVRNDLIEHLLGWTDMSYLWFDA
ncbi:nucleotide-diphospho-sugar transferase, partial [Vararia minispora EC-137]